jgi:hypothetical protein
LRKPFEDIAVDHHGCGTFSKRPFEWGSGWTIPVGTCAIVG